MMGNKINEQTKKELFIIEMMNFGVYEDRGCSDEEREQVLKQAEELYDKHLTDQKAELLKTIELLSGHKAKLLVPAMEIMDELNNVSVEFPEHTWQAINKLEQAIKEVTI